MVSTQPAILVLMWFYLNKRWNWNFDIFCSAYLKKNTSKFLSSFWNPTVCSKIVAVFELLKVRSRMESCTRYRLTKINICIRIHHSSSWYVMVCHNLRTLQTYSLKVKSVIKNTLMRSNPNYSYYNYNCKNKVYRALAFESMRML